MCPPFAYTYYSIEAWPKTEAQPSAAGAASIAGSAEAIHITYEEAAYQASGEVAACCEGVASSAGAVVGAGSLRTSCFKAEGASFIACYLAINFIKVPPSYSPFYWVLSPSVATTTPSITTEAHRMY